MVPEAEEKKPVQKRAEAAVAGTKRPVKTQLRRWCESVSEHIPNTNTEEEIPGRTEKTHAYPEDGEDVEKTLEELEHLEKGGDTGRRRRGADQNCKEAEQRHKEVIKGEQSAGDIDKPPFSDPAALRPRREVTSTGMCPY
ncbi:hypothetical protein NDU88_006744 [Pleurodeles waltl]|uniref:Uncharacterized protein n=1 Tax=Pleurodeles waltl TaxID=8319 RepID=A0AAV7RN39_PLEWA|nr:hypothetical protein NDU88_006744 [Pleurodeles waltl]